MLSPGAIIGSKYRVKNTLAEGGMAELYLVEPVCGPEGKLFVAKKPLSQKLNKLFDDEITIAQYLSHPGIVRTVDVIVQEKDKKILILEYLIGQNLKQILINYQNNNFDLRVAFALSLAQKILPALEYLHNLKGKNGDELCIVHQDLSLSNIIITHNGEVKLIDFGAALYRENYRLGPKKKILGKIAFMAPEQVLGGYVSCKSDLFSLSLILVEIIFGKSLFAGKSDNIIQELLVCAEELSLPRLGKSWKSLRAILKRGLKKNPDHRFGSSREYLDAVNQAIIEYEITDPERILQSNLLQSRSKDPDSGINITNWIFMGVLAGLVLVLLFGMISRHGRRLSAEIFTPIIDPSIRHLLEAESIDNLNREKKNKTKKKNESGTLRIVVRPWAEVYVEDKLIGTTPMIPIKLPEGNYLIKLRNPHLSKTALRMVRIIAKKKKHIFHDFGNP